MKCYFCTNCGSRLLHQMYEANSAPGEALVPAATTNVKGGCLEGLDKGMMKDVIHIWTKHAIVDIPEGAQQWPEGVPRNK